MISEDEFIECMGRDFPHLKVTKNDLARPTKQFIVQYYASMLEQITRMSVNKLCSITEEQHEILASSVDGSLTEHASTHNLYMAVKYVFDKIELFTESFHYSDILFPSLAPKRSFVFMTKLYDFYTTCAEFDYYYEEADKLDSKRYELAKLKEENMKLKDDIQLNEQKKIVVAERKKDIIGQLNDLSSRKDVDLLAVKKLQAEEKSQKEKYNILDEQERKMKDLLVKADNEKKHFESLIVSDDCQILEHQAKLTKKMEACKLRLEQLEKQVHDGSSKVSHFDKILNLNDSLNQVLRGEITIENKSLDLKGIHNSASVLKKECQMLDEEEAELQGLLQEKDEALPCSQNELARLDAEKDSIACTWQEKKGRYQSWLNDLQRSVSELTHRDQIVEAGLKDATSNLEQLSEKIAKKQEEILNMDKANLEQFARFETELIQVLRRFAYEAISYQKNHGT